MGINRELAFAEDYYHIKAGGIVVLDENTPEEIRIQFWKTWPSFHKLVAERQMQGMFSSAYSVLPMEDPKENKKHYIDAINEPVGNGDNVNTSGSEM